MKAGNKRTQVINLGWGKLRRHGIIKEGRAKWRLRWSDSGKRREYTLWAENTKQAKEYAEQARFSDLGKGQKFFPQPVEGFGEGRLLIEDAMLQAAEVQTWTEKTREDFIWYCKKFLEWSGRRLQYWDQLTPADAEQYLKFLWEKGYKQNTIRLRMTALRTTCQWLSRREPDKYRNICAGLRIDKRHSQVTEIEEPKVLTIGQVCEFIDWLDDSPELRHLAPAVALQGLACLRLTEALRLEWSNVDLEEATVKITGRVKNEPSARKIPLCLRVVQVLSKAERSGPRVMERYSRYDAMGPALRRAMMKWKPAAAVPPMNLRKTVPTAAYDGGWDSNYVDGYMGHAAGSVKARHYQKSAKRIELMRQRVIWHIDEEVRLHDLQKEGVVALIKTG